MKNALSALCFWFIFQCPAAAQTPGKDSLIIHQVDSLTSLLDSVHLWYETRQNYCTALVAELQTCRSKLSENSPASIKALQVMGRASAYAGKRDEADSLLQQAKTALENTGQKETGAYARNLLWLGETVWDTTIGWLNYGTLSMPFTKTCYAEAVGIFEKIEQTDAPDYEETLYKLVYLCHHLFLKTERDFFAAKLFACYEKSVLTGRVLHRDMPYMLCMGFGYCQEARKIIQYTLDSLGENHPDYLHALVFFAGTYDWEGRYEEAVEYYEKVEHLRQNPPVKYERVENINGNSDVGWDYWKLARYEEAEKIFADLYKQNRQGPARNWTFNGIMLANIYTETGRYKEAEKLLNEVLDSLPEYPDAVNNLAKVYIHQGRLLDALPLHHKAAELYDRDGGCKCGRFYALSLQNLSWVYNELGDQPAALRYFQEAEVLNKSIKGIEHPDYGMLLRQGATIYRAMGRVSEADSLCKVSKNILAKSLGKKHPAYLKTCMEYGKNAFQDERWASAAERFGEAAGVQSDLLRQSAKYLSERELLAFQRTLTGYSDLFFSLMQKTPAGGPNPMAPFAYDQALILKGFALEGKLAVSSHVARAEKPVQEKYAAWVGLHRRLATQYAKPVSERQSVEELEVEANVLEKELTKSFAVFAEAQRKTSCADVRSALKTGEIAIEFVHYRFANPSPTDSTMYAALVLRPGADAPVFVPLFEEKSLDALLDRNAERNEFYVKRLYTLADRGAKPLEKPQKTLYELLWKPLEPHMQGVNTVYYSPAGLLHRLNLAAIPTSVDSVLADHYNLVELGSTRQLVSPATTRPAANDALLFGGIRYDADSTEIAQANAGKDSILIASRNLSRSLRSELGFAYTDSTLRTLTWGDLPFTEQEVSRVEKILKSAGFQSETLRGYATTEEAFKTMCAGEKPSPRVLHVATHGFFFPDPKEAVRGERVSGEQEPPFILSDHPMIRSGLILAGGNHAWATGKALRADMEDGILTAYEISQMNLSNTELVVLSACETGLGDIQGNEGVYGLQRAFKIAGARYLIMSLWRVPDKQTSLLMTTFYKKWLEEKMEIPEAFRAAQKELREAGLDPYQWAGFVLVE